jgi:2,4-dienoyl-CoA reductase (NADPH2)
MRVPRGAYSWAAAWLKSHVSIPVSATNRINTPELAEEIISSGKADLVSLARPLLADPQFVKKARTGNAHRINTCIACNQACLDQIFSGETASCLVNPFAARELTWKIIPTKNTKRIAIIGAGVAGCAASITLSQRGFQVEVFEKSNAIGGQFKWAAQIPGKEEMNETLRYYAEELKALHIPIHLNCSEAAWLEKAFDFHVITTGVVPKELNSLKSDHSIPVLNYIEAIEQESSLGKEIVIIGSGGIAMDVASLLGSEPEGITDYQNHWGVDASLHFPGALKEKVWRVAKRKIHFVQRSGKKLGFKLGKTTVWSHRTELAELGTQIHSHVSNMEIRDGAFYMTKGDITEMLQPAAVINCTGQESTLPLQFNETNHVVLGGAKSNERLDAKRAIYEATAWAIQFEL